MSGADFADRLVAAVSDELDNPVSGVEVGSSACRTPTARRRSRAAVRARTVTTGADGRATSPLVRGVRAGVVEATATVDGADGATYELTVTAGSPRPSRAVAGTGQTWVRVTTARRSPLRWWPRWPTRPGTGSAGCRWSSPCRTAMGRRPSPTALGPPRPSPVRTVGRRARALTGGRAGALVATARVAGVAEAATYALTVGAVEVSRSADLRVELKAAGPGWARPGNAAGSWSSRPTTGTRRRPGPRSR